MLLSGIFFAAKIAQPFGVTGTLSNDGRLRTCQAGGQPFCGSVDEFMATFDIREALDMAEMKFRCEDAVVDGVFPPAHRIGHRKRPPSGSFKEQRENIQDPPEAVP